MAISKELLDQLIADYKKPEDLIGENGILKQLTKALLERAMQAEITDHLGYPRNAPEGNNSGNSRNGSYKKKLKGDFGEIDVAVPRDRNGSFEPIIVPKGETRFKRFDDKIITMYARGMTTRDIQSHLEEIYSAPTVEQAEANLITFGEKWDATHPRVSQSWQNNWQRIIPYFAYPPEIRRVIYTTNTIESLNMSLRKVTKNRGSFPNDESMFKLLYLALMNISKRWTMPIKNWKSALNQFSIMFEERLPEF